MSATGRSTAAVIAVTIVIESRSATAVTGEMKTSLNFYGGNIPETELYENQRCLALGDCKELAETRIGSS